jgi:Protein of unknown function (DUF2971)
MEKKPYSDMWCRLRDKDQYVYHYTKSSTAAEYIIPTMKLRFSRFENLNDPREYENWDFDYFAVRMRDDINFSKLELELNSLLKHSCRVGCFVADTANSVVTSEGIDDGKIDMFQAAFERGHARHRMWAQYGEDYAGVCFVFDEEKLDLAIRLAAKRSGLDAFAGHVSYENPAVVFGLGQAHGPNISLDEIDSIGIKNTVKRHFSRYVKDLFSKKSKDWAQEKEYRWLVAGESEGDFFVDIKDSIVGIALGDRYPDKYRPVAHDLGRTRDIQVIKMDWKNGYPQPKPELWGRFPRSA